MTIIEVAVFDCMSSYVKGQLKSFEKLIYTVKKNIYPILALPNNAPQARVDVFHIMFEA